MTFKRYELVESDKRYGLVIRLPNTWRAVDHASIQIIVTNARSNLLYRLTKIDHVSRTLYRSDRITNSGAIYTVVVPSKYRQHKRKDVLKHLLSLLSTYSEIDTISINESETKHVLTLSLIEDRLVVTGKEQELSIPMHDQSVYDICGHVQSIHSYTIILKHESEKSRDVDVFESI